MRGKTGKPESAELGRKLGRAIAQRRKAQALTQNDLAGMVDVEVETVSRIERGSTVPSLQRLAVIAQALGAGAGELLGEASPIVNDRAATLATTMALLAERDQQLLLDFALLLKERR